MMPMNPLSMLLGMSVLYSTHVADAVIPLGTDHCSQVQIEYRERTGMTDAERRADMDGAFFDSVNRFKLCDSANQAVNASDQAAKPSPSSGEEGANESIQQATKDEETGSEETGSDDPTDTNNIESIPSSLMTGTETESTSLPEELVTVPDIKASDMASDIVADAVINAPAVKGETVAPAKTATANNPNGVVPADIPDVNNDDVVAQQIRLAASIEQDEAKKEKLWNEYRKYKGLPTKDDE